MAKYDWKLLEKEYILGNYKSISDFFKDKEIPNNSRNRSNTKGWKEKKSQKSDKTVTKIIEQVIEKEAKKETEKIIQVTDVAKDLLAKIVQANSELNKHLARNKKKTKTVKYDYICNKHSKETIYEEEEIKSYIDIIDIKGLKELTSALKDISDIINNKPNGGQQSLDNAKEILIKIRKATKNNGEGN